MRKVLRNAWVSAVYLLYYGVDVWQGGAVRKLWEAVGSNNLVYLGLGFMLDCWVYGHCEEE